jgi:hypothetical protein
MTVAGSIKKARPDRTNPAFGQVRSDRGNAARKPGLVNADAPSGEARITGPKAKQHQIEVPPSWSPPTILAPCRM